MQIKQYSSVNPKLTDYVPIETNSGTKSVQLKDIVSLTPPPSFTKYNGENCYIDYSPYYSMLHIERYDTQGLTLIGGNNQSNHIATLPSNISLLDHSIFWNPIAVMSSWYPEMYGALYMMDQQKLGLRVPKQYVAYEICGNIIIPSNKISLK